MVWKFSITPVIYFRHNCVTCGRLQEWATYSLECGSGWSYGVYPYLFFLPRSCIWFFLTLIYKLQPEIRIVAGYGPAEFFQYWLFSGQVMYNWSMHRWTTFTFMNGLLLLDYSIGQSNFYYRFYLKLKTDQLSFLTRLYDIA